MIKALSDIRHWDGIYDPGAADEASVKPGRLKAALRRLLGPTMLAYTRDYRDYLLWTVTYAKLAPVRTGATVLEVGSAPGYHLIQLRDAFGLAPYGVEYSPNGAEINRKVFERHGVSAANVIQADFFSSAFQDAYANHFDVVVSHGFIEHFTDVESVIAKHVHVLAPGGRLVVTIPNLRGINYCLAWLFRRELIPLHNLSIMRQGVFCRLFSGRGIAPLLCGYQGTFSFGLFNVPPTSRRRYLLKVCGVVQRVLNVLFRLLFGARGAESRHFSPALVFVGVKEP